MPYASDSDNAKVPDAQVLRDSGGAVVLCVDSRPIAIPRCPLTRRVGALIGSGFSPLAPEILAAPGLQRARV